MSLDLLELVFGNSQIGITPEGGIYEIFKNSTGTVSAKGTIVVASRTTAGGVSIAPAASTSPIGVIYEGGVAQGGDVKVVTYGKAEVLLASNQTSTLGYWCGVSSSEQGRMYQLSNPPTEGSTHSQEIGHSLQTVAVAGSLSPVQIHFN